MVADIISTRVNWYGQNGMDKVALGQSGIGRDGLDKVALGQSGLDKMVWTKWH